MNYGGIIWAGQSCKKGAQGSDLDAAPSAAAGQAGGPFLEVVWSPTPLPFLMGGRKK